MQGYLQHQITHKTYNTNKEMDLLSYHKNIFVFGLILISRSVAFTLSVKLCMREKYFSRKT